MYLIVGGDSKIGRAISNSWSNRVLFHSSTRVKNLESSTRPYIDLSDIDSININHSYRVIVVAAGVTSIQECEDNPEKTRLINVVNTSLLVNKLCRNGALVVFLSSNQVFDGNLPYRKATDSKNPISEYGKQKSETEDLLLSNCDNVSILRMTKVVDNEFALIKKWKKNFINGKKIHPFFDMMLATTEIDKVVHYINDIVMNKRVGIYHIPSGKDITYESLAKKVCLSVNGDCSLIRPVSYSSIIPPNQHVPKYTSLK